MIAINKHFIIIGIMIGIVASVISLNMYFSLKAHNDATVAVTKNTQALLGGQQHIMNEIDRLMVFLNHTAENKTH